MLRKFPGDVNKKSTGTSVIRILVGVVRVLKVNLLSLLTSRKSFYSCYLQDFLFHKAKVTCRYFIIT